MLASFPPGGPSEVFRRVCGYACAGAFRSIVARGTPSDARAVVELVVSRAAAHHLRPPPISVRWPHGRRYLDCVNNVAHVGHQLSPGKPGNCRPAWATGNTNTRYLHEHLADYIEALAATLPPPLSVVYLVCSGSEVNELALRLARAYTGRDRIFVLEAAYHGNTSALVDISPYKFNGKGGRGKPSHVEIMPLPDPYRGPHRGADSTARYAAEVAEAAHRAGGPAAFFAESASGCGGQVFFPGGYLAKAFDIVRASGGVCASRTKCRLDSAAPVRIFGCSRPRVRCRISSPWGSLSRTATPWARW